MSSFFVKTSFIVVFNSFDLNLGQFSISNNLNQLKQKKLFNIFVTNRRKSIKLMFYVFRTEITNYKSRRWILDLMVNDDFESTGILSQRLQC